MLNMQSYDIAVVGGGMVGLAFAAALKDTTLKVVVIEGNEIDLELGEQPDLRVSALSRASQNILQNLDAWGGIETRRKQAYNAMQVWDRDGFGRIDFDGSALMTDTLGHLVENKVIQLALLEQIEKAGNITLLTSTKIRKLSQNAEAVWLTLEGQEPVYAKLIVGADGANSWTRQQVNIPLVSWDYNHSAIVANIRTVEPHQNCARQIFNPEGPLAFLPLWQPDLSSIVWSLPPERAAVLLAMDEADFNKALTVAFDGRLGVCQVEGQRQSFPLKMRYARSFATDRVALIGDAAHTLHPLAGQGVNLGLLDAASLAQCVLANHQQQKDIGAHRNLREFERWRKTEAAVMIASMEGLKRLFSGSHPAKRLFRDVGLTLSNVLPGVKLQFIKRAMGLDGELPELAK
ncbi:MAG: 2-octaprenylphenol hydroxylase [Moritella sp.]|jgi:2-octaprenylphenol hydroxylase